MGTRTLTVTELSHRVWDAAAHAYTYVCTALVGDNMRYIMKNDDPHLLAQSALSLYSFEDLREHVFRHKADKCYTFLKDLYGTRWVSRFDTTSPFCNSFCPEYYHLYYGLYLAVSYRYERAVVDCLNYLKGTPGELEVLWPERQSLIQHVTLNFAPGTDAYRALVDVMGAKTVTEFGRDPAGPPVAVVFTPWQGAGK